MSDNKNLHSAKTAQKDEFYTQMSDIEIEMNAYLEYDKNVFKDKIIFCNCDDPYESNFFKYFALRFNDFGLKKLIATCYSGSPVAGTQLSLFDEPTETEPQKTAYKVIINEVKDLNGDGAVDLKDIELLLANENNVATELDGNGDFKSKECIELLEHADIIVTNPPFSLFRDYVAQLFEHEKKFIIIGNVNAITYKEIFPLIMNNKMWLGSSIHSGDREFRVPDSYPLNAAGTRVDKNGIKYIRVKGVRWFTNLPTNDRYERLQLMTRADNLRFNKHLQKKLNKLHCCDYPKYDNYDALEIPVTDAIPKDYKGIMGAPITFLDKYCPEQFEIIGITKTPLGNKLRTKLYDRQIQVNPNGTTKSVMKANDGATITIKEPVEKKPYYKVGDIMLYAFYPRILIKYTTEWINNHPQDFEDS